ncbi:hypothetical protein LCGC14_2540610, partial [marine sediment metagenome]
MDRRFAIRKQEMLAECEVLPHVFRGVEEGMEEFMQPFSNVLGCRHNASTLRTTFLGWCRISREGTLSRSRIDMIKTVGTCNTLWAALSGTINRSLPNWR